MSVENYLKTEERRRHVKDTLGLSAREKAWAGLGCTEAADRIKATYRAQHAWPQRPAGARAHRHRTLRLLSAAHQERARRKPAPSHMRTRTAVRFA